MKKRLSKKELEELKLDLIEIQAYRNLQDEAFCFNGKDIIKSESKISEDVIWKIQEQNIKRILKTKRKS